MCLYGHVCHKLIHTHRNRETERQRERWKNGLDSKLIMQRIHQLILNQTNYVINNIEIKNHKTAIHQIIKQNKSNKSMRHTIWWQSGKLMENFSKRKNNYEGDTPQKRKYTIKGVYDLEQNFCYLKLYNPSRWTHCCNPQHLNFYINLFTNNPSVFTTRISDQLQGTTWKIWDRSELR